MQHEGIPPDAVTLGRVLKACNSIVPTRKLHADIVRNAYLRKNTMCGNALVGMYAKCSILIKAFEELPTCNLMSWNVLIAGFCDQGHVDKALSCFERMKCDNISPDEVTFACVLKACGTISCSQQGYMYIKCGAFTKAASVFRAFGLGWSHLDCSSVRTQSLWSITKVFGTRAPLLM